MSVSKIVRILALLVAVFVELPYVALALVILGLIAGFMGVDEDGRGLYFAMANALSLMSGALEPIPMVGGYLTAILGNISTVISAGAIAVICTVIYERVTE